MNLYILPEHKAIEESKSYKENTAIISITQPDEDDVVFADNPYIKDIFRMKFYDITREIKEYDISPASIEDFSGLKEFVDSLEGMQIKQLIVHCAAGISRSAAVAAAIDEYLNLGNKIWNNVLYFPNMHVYKVACKELGLERTQEDYEKLFDVRTKHSGYSGW